MNIFDPDFQKKGFVIGLMACAALVGMLVGYGVSRSDGVEASGLSIKNTSTLIRSSVTPTSIYTRTPTQTITPSPTLTHRATSTQLPSHTPSPTYTQTGTPTATKMIRLPPTRTETSVPPNEPPPPTATVPAPVTIESCSVDPFTVPIGINVDVTYIVRFSTRISGYGFDALVDPVYSGQSGCSGVDNDGDGLAYCVGSSGILSEPTTVNVTLTSSVGDCVVSYSSR